jgi:hypothetical protein
MRIGAGQTLQIGMLLMIFEPQMYGRKFWALSLAIGIIATSACSGKNNSRGFFGTEPNSREFIVNEPLGDVTFTKGITPGDTLSLNLAVGSGAFRPIGASNDVFYTVTDRGPTIDCADSEQGVGIADFCGAGNSGDIFALKDFTPRIIKWQLSGVGTGLKLTQSATMNLIDSNATALNGLPNNFTSATVNKAYDNTGAEIAPSSNGIDPEALILLDNGKFWVAEENGPSLLLVDADGTVLERQLPAGLASDLNGANYTVKDDVLPAILARRKVGEGIEALAVSPDNKYLYFVMQSPLANPDAASVADSRIVRIGKVELNADGTANSMVGEYVYRLDPPSHFAQKNSTDNKGDLKSNGDFVDQTQVTVNEAIALAEDHLVLVEQANTVSKYYRVNLANATNILGTSWDSTTTSPSLEEQENITGVTFAVKQLGFDSLTLPLPTGITALGKNIEGMALLDANFAVVLNDNQYGIYGDKGRVAVLPLGAFVVTSSAPIQPKLDYAKSASFKDSGSNVDQGAAQVVAGDGINKHLFVVNTQTKVVDVLNVDVTDPAVPVMTKATPLDLAAAANSAGITIGIIPKWVTIGGNHVAVVLETDDPQANGIVALYKLDDLSLTATYEVGAAPKMAAFNLTSSRLLVANEGVANANYTVDPVGSVTAIDLIAGFDSGVVTTIDFSDFNVGGSRAADLPDTVRVFGPNASVAQDLEPEHIAISLDNTKAFVTLQENNAVAVINLADNTIISIVGLGSKNFGLKGNELDVLKDANIKLETWPGVYGLYQPDGIGSYRYALKNYFITVNEGRARDSVGYSEKVRAVELGTNPNPAIDGSNPSFTAASDNSQLGQLTVSNAYGDTDNDTDIDEITAFGARSFSIWSEQGDLVYDSGADLAKVTSLVLDTSFNDIDVASEETGSGPKSLVLVSSIGRIYAFVSLNRAGGIAIYDVTSPLGVQFVQYVNNRDFTANEGGDFGADGMAVLFIEGIPYLALANAGSGNVRLMQIDSGVTATP